ncbi:MAG: 4-(cytidine 5'-diphospho)-2-C-methyl-D-erythritol kinase [Bacteroidota bacterium]
MICFPNAKINIGLNIVEKRSDGFHNIESVFFPVGLCDILEIVRINDKNKRPDKCLFTYSAIQFPSDVDSSEAKNMKNLCVKAYNLLDSDIDLPPVRIHLHKIIPVGAGLGGGSSDAAFTIKLLNDIFDLKLSTGKMEDYARKLGSDCAFFINSKPVFAYEKGDRFELIDLDLSGYNIVLVNPGIHIDTSKAYFGYAQYEKLGLKYSNTKASIKKLIKFPVSEWKGVLHNDFENFIFQNHPEIEQIKEKFYSLGAEYSSMSGSGSTVYGLFSTFGEKKKLSIKAEFKKCFVWKGKCCDIR